MGFALARHPDSPCDTVSSVEVEVIRDGATLTLDFVITGRIGELALPPLAPSTRADELWKHTCFEAFVRPEPGEAYLEFNFAPSTQWAAYRFTGYREGMAPADIIPRIEVATSDGALRLVARLALPPGPCRLAITAVIEARDGAKSYWSLAHPPGRPDFHHAAGFVLSPP